MLVKKSRCFNKAQHDLPIFDQHAETHPFTALFPIHMHIREQIDEECAQKKSLLR